MLVSALLAIAAASPAQSPPATKVPAKQDRTICRMEQEVHSRIPVRICMKESEWEQMARETQEDLRRSTNDRQVVSN